MAPDQNEPMLQFFVHAHLPKHLADVSRPFSELAHQIVAELPRNPERTVALRKLLEAKDCAVRALVYKSDVTFSTEPKFSGTLAVFSGFPELTPPIHVTKHEDGQITVTDKRP